METRYTRNTTDGHTHAVRLQGSAASGVRYPITVCRQIAPAGLTKEGPATCPVCRDRLNQREQP